MSFRRISAVTGRAGSVAALSATLAVLIGTALLAQTPVPRPVSVPAARRAGPRLNLAQALRRARANSPAFQKALTAIGLARGARTQARAALLPSASLDGAYIYTQNNIFVANNGVHEYLAQGNLHEGLNFGSRAMLAESQAGVALARAQAEIARRGLTATVVTDYYTVLAGAHDITAARQALASAKRYLRLSQERERGGEAAREDVVRAEVQLEQSRRTLRDARLAREQARLALAVLLFPNFDEQYSLVDDLDSPPPLPPESRVRALAAAHNPEIAAAESLAQQAHDRAGVARAGLLPGLNLDYFYGIDANQFALRNGLGQRNLGNSVQATLTIPVFDWGASRSRLAQAHLQETQARRELSAAQRQLLARLQSLYAAARVAHEDLTTLARSRSLARESLRLTALQYRNGIATILALVEAQQTLAAANTAYDAGELRYRVTLAELQTLTGTLQP